MKIPPNISIALGLVAAFAAAGVVGQLTYGGQALADQAKARQLLVLKNAFPNIERTIGEWKAGHTLDPATSDGITAMDIRETGDLFYAKTIVIAKDDDGHVCFNVEAKGNIAGFDTFSGPEINACTLPGETPDGLNKALIANTGLGLKDLNLR
jgi:hypothetical protein